MHVTVWTVVVAFLVMVTKDSVATALVVAESKGRANVAAGLAAFNDLATIAVTVVGAGPIIDSGTLTGGAVAVLAAMMCASVTGTYVLTRLTRRMHDVE